MLKIHFLSKNKISFIKPYKKIEVSFYMFMLWKDVKEDIWSY